MKKLLLASLLFSFGYLQAQTNTILIPASKNNTLIEDPNGGLSNGTGTYLYSGRTNATSQSIRRALIQFDLSFIPGNAVIDTAIIHLNIASNAAAINGNKQLNFHRLISDWGEGSSAESATDLGTGSGALVTNGSATWLDGIYNTSPWMQAGGDYHANPSASISAASPNTNNFTLIGSQSITADVRNWHQGNIPNYGWIIKGDESVAGSLLIFFSRASSSSHSPRLEISYSFLTQIDELEKESSTLSIYPNPVDEELRVSFDKEGTFDLRVLDINGKTVYRTKFNLSRSLNIESLESGIYFLEIETGSNVITKKFIKR